MGLDGRRDDVIDIDDLLFRRTYRRIITHLRDLGPGPLTLLASDLKMNRSKLDARIAALEACGLVRKTEERGTFYVLTTEGSDKLTATTPEDLDQWPSWDE